MKTRKRTLWALFLTLFIVTSCLKQAEEDNIPFIPKSVHPEAKQTIEELLRFEYNDLDSFTKYAKQLADNNQDSLAQFLGNYYLAKSEFYYNRTEENIVNLSKFYDEFKAREMTHYLVEIDLLLYQFYYDYKFLDKANGYLADTYEYIFAPEYKYQRASMILGETPVFNENDAEIKISEIEKFLENEEETEWNYYLGKVYFGLAQANYVLNNKGEYKRIILDIAEKAEKAGLLTQAAIAYHKLSYFGMDLSTKEKLKYAQLALEYFEKSKHTYFREILWRVLGHTYFEQKNFKKSFDCYQNAWEYSQFLQDPSDQSIDLAYMAWAYFNINPEQNYDQANQYFSQAIKNSNHQGDATHMALERKKWALERLNKNQEAKQVTEELAKFILDRDEVLQSSYDTDFHALNLFKFKNKDHLINSLTLSNELKSERLKRSKYVFILFIVLLGAIGFIVYLLTKRISILAELNTSRHEVELANKHLVEQNSIITEQNERLTKKRKMIESELKSKLTLFESSMKSIEHLTEMIKKHPNIDRMTQRDLLNAINPTENQRLIENIDFQFIDLNKEFFNRLSKRHPNLTNNNQKLCVYLKMNLSTKEISSLTFTSPEAIKVSRSRLRKKLGLKQKQSLTGYLNSI